MVGYMMPVLQSLQGVRESYHGLPPWAQDTVQAAVLILVAFIVIQVIAHRIKAFLERLPKVDKTALKFVVRVFDMVAWIIVAGLVLSVYGVDTTALLGGLAIGGFILGFALKDTLGNLAAGVMLLFYRPFNVGDWVTIGGDSGGVVQLGMALTTMKAADGRIVTQPNGSVLGNTIINHTREPIRRADVLVGISYGDDIDAAIKAILEALRQDPRVLAEPEPAVWVTGLADSSVGLQVRPWVRTPDLWVAQAEFHGMVKRALEAAGCTIPFPQRDIHMFREE